MEINFSKGVLNYALENNITKAQLEAGYKNLIPGVYTYVNRSTHVLLKNEISDYYYDYRTDLFYESSCKETFILIWDALFLDVDRKDKSIVLDSNIDTTGIVLKEETDIQTFYSLIKAKVQELDHEEFIKIVEESKSNALNQSHSFSRSLIPALFSKFGVDIVTEESEEAVLNRFRDFYFFQDAFEDYCEENDFGLEGEYSEDEEDDEDY